MELSADSLEAVPVYRLAEAARMTKRFYCPICDRYLYEVELEERCPVCSGLLEPADVEGA